MAYFNDSFINYNKFPFKSKDCFGIFNFNRSTPVFLVMSVFIQWYKNSRRIVENSESNIVIAGLTLLIEHAQEDDAGEYMCTVDTPFVTGFTDIGRIFSLNKHEVSIGGGSRNFEPRKIDKGYISHSLFKRPQHTEDVRTLNHDRGNVHAFVSDGSLVLSRFESITSKITPSVSS
ncbi:uncharacterized protein TNCV_4605831 [Trichonephila clavipes]|nr:uncharacterized protein TNCV_4605831 [Trichonephila clavipes]